MGLLEKLHQQIVQSDWTKKFEEEGKMNIEKIKEFVALSKDLYATGVIGVFMGGNELQVKETVLIGKKDLCVENRFCDTYPYEVSIIRDGIKISAIMTKEKLQELYPKLYGYMQEDVDLSGGDENVEEHHMELHQRSI